MAPAPPVVPVAYPIGLPTAKAPLAAKNTIAMEPSTYIMKLSNLVQFFCSEVGEMEIWFGSASLLYIYA